MIRLEQAGQRVRWLESMSETERVEYIVYRVADQVYAYGLGEEGRLYAILRSGRPYSSDAPYYRMLSEIGKADSLAVISATEIAIDDFETSMRAGPDDVELAYLDSLGLPNRWSPPTEEELAGWAEITRAEVYRVAFESNPPAPYVPGPGGSPPVDPMGLSAALVLDSEQLAAGSIVSNSFRVDGRDHDLTGQLTGAPGTHGIATTEALRQTALAAIPAGRLANITGVGPAPDLVAQEPGLDLEALAQAVLAHPDLLTLTAAPPGPLGTAEAPAVVYVPGPAAEVPQAYQGFGILLADGKVKLATGSEWRGLVLSRSAQPEIRLAGTARIIGGAAATGGPISLRLYDQAAVLRSAAALQIALDALDSAP